MWPTHLRQLVSSSAYTPVALQEDEKPVVTGTPFRELRGHRKGLAALLERPLFVFVATAVATTLLWLGVFAAVSARKSSHLVSSAEIIPKGTPVATTFIKSYDYAAPYSDEATSMWRSMADLQDTRGIPVRHPEIYGLPRGYPSEEDPSLNIYMPSFHHQLHCLVFIRNHYKLIAQGNDTTHSHNPEHVEHCFDYIRQAILCFGDTTLEWPALYPDGRVQNLDGIGVTHQCRDVDGAQQYIKDHSMEFYTIASDMSHQHNHS